MLKYCLKKWDAHKDDLEKALAQDTTLNECEYKHLVELVVRYILNGDGRTWDENEITVVDNGYYQGTLLFLIHEICYQPDECDYLMTYVGYGSCSGCDTLLHIQGYDNKPPTASQIKDYMDLCKDIVTNMVKPYNTGWRHKEEFEEVKFDG
jgi:hypothetical protein